MNTELQNSLKFKFKKVDFNLIRLEPEYLTKYGKQYHQLYNPYKYITREEYYNKYKNKPFVSLWDNNTNTEEEEYKSSFESDSLDNLYNYEYQPINNEEVDIEEEIQQIIESSDSEEEEFITL
tara:strand:- start:589 stop:957 length:369 start_codon:yes stop_codon:yes gene_type:complete